VKFLEWSWKPGPASVLTEWLALLGMLGWTLLVAAIWLSALTGRSSVRVSA
jgi:hypothetical protein